MGKRQMEVTKRLSYFGQVVRIQPNCIPNIPLLEGCSGRGMLADPRKDCSTMLKKIVRLRPYIGLTVWLCKLQISLRDIGHYGEIMSAVCCRLVYIAEALNQLSEVKATPRLWAESTGVNDIIEWMIWFLSYESCCGKPIILNSVLKGCRQHLVRWPFRNIQMFSRWIFELSDIAKK